jgi:hypothetical protein
MVSLNLRDKEDERTHRGSDGHISGCTAGWEVDEYNRGWYGNERKYRINQMKISER